MDRARHRERLDSAVKRNPRATGKPCPCGSGLPGLRNLKLDCTQYIACSKCLINEGGRTYREYQNDEAKRQAAARRKIEERAEARAAEGDL